MANPKIYQVANLQSQLSSANNNANNRVLKTGDTMTGNLTFSGTGLRILGDFSNGTLANRLAFQTTTTDGTTAVWALPNGTSNNSNFAAFSNSDPTNASTMQIRVGASSSDLVAGNTGVGSYLPMTFFSGGSESMRIDTAGRLLVGTTSNTWGSLARLQIAGSGTLGSVSFAKTDVTASGGSITGIDSFGYDGSTYVVAGTINFRAEETWNITNHGSLIQFRTTNAGSGGALSEKMRITANGNVGIGVSTADSKLHVAGSFRQTGATVPFEWTVNAGAADFYKLNAVGYADNLIVLNGAGRVGFGTNNPSTAGRVTIANNMGMVISHETAGVDIRVGFGNVTGNSNSHTGTVLGYRALNNSSVVSYSVAVGYDALETSTTGVENVAMGYYALKRLTTGRDNIGIGTYAGQSLTTGRFNVAVGRAALTTANTSDYNTAVGYQSMYYTTTGYQNSAYGSLCMQDNTTGYYNSAFGVNALRTNTTGYVNDAFGVNALFGNTTGIENKAFGYQALYYNTTGSYNVCIGSNAMVYNQTSSYNTMVGNFAGQGVSANSCGIYNTAMGYAALYSIRSSGSFNNTAIGPYALHSLTTGYNNTTMGYYTGFSVTTGRNNTIIGYESGYYTTSLTTGINNVFLGAYTRGSSASAEHQIVIGYDLAGVGDNYVAIGKAGAYIYNQFNTNATWTQTSDERLKKNIQTDNLGLSFINRLRPVTYNWKASNELDPTNPLYKTENDRDTATVMHGLIAQEVKTAMEAEGCNTFGGWDEKNGIQSISREQFISPLINAVKELSAKIAMLEAEIQTLKGG